MNRHTFKDAVSSRRQALANDIDDDDDDDDNVRTLRTAIEGEEEDGTEKFNDVGEVIEPFNMRDERDGGMIDENMNYVFSKQKGEVDAWLAGMDETAMEKGIGEAAEALRKKNEKREQEEKFEESRSKLTTQQAKLALLKILVPEETVSQALRRLGGLQTKAKKSYTKGIKKEKVTESEESLEEKRANRKLIDGVTDLANQLLSEGIPGIYDMTFESIEASTVSWEYAGSDGTIHGPFTSEMISNWKQQGYFTGPSAVMMRKIIPTEGPSELLKSDKRNIDEENESKEKSQSKRAKVSAEQEFVNDFDDDDDDGPQLASKPKEEKNETTNVEITRGPWISSDEIDFGQFVTLPDNENENDDVEENED